MKKLPTFIFLLLLHAAIFYVIFGYLKPEFRQFIDGRLIHFLAFFLMAFLIVMFLLQLRLNVYLAFLLSFIYCILMAVFIEYVHFHRYNMTYSVPDIIASAQGSAFYILMAYAALRYKTWKSDKEKRKG